MVLGLETAMKDLKEGKFVCPYECNARIRSYYNWENVTSRTEIVYGKIIQESTKTLAQHLNG